MRRPWFYPRLVAYSFFWLSERVRTEAVEVTVRRNKSRPDLISHDEYPRSYGGEATTRLKPSDNVSHNRKIGIGTARQRCICQHKGGEGLGLIVR